MKRFWAVAMSVCLFTGSFSQMSMSAYAEETVQSQGINEQAGDFGDEADINTQNDEEQVTDLMDPEATPETGEIPETEETPDPEATPAQTPDTEEEQATAIPTAEPTASPSAVPQESPELTQEIDEALFYDGNSGNYPTGGATAFASESSGTLSSDGKYLYAVTDSQSKLATLKGYYGANPGDNQLVVPYEINGYYMSELGAGVFEGMNTVDNSNLSKLYSVKDNYTTTNLSSVETDILNEMNKERISKGLHPLVMDTSLRAVARIKSKDMINNDYFSHDYPASTSNVTNRTKKVWNWLDTIGYKYGSVGENIAWNTNDAKQLYNQWKSSSGHYDNMMKTGFYSVGIGVYSGNGKYMGTQVFTSTRTMNVRKVKIEYGYGKIGDNSFKGCSNLTWIEIPSSVMEISSNAFSGCGNFTIYGVKGSYAELYANNYSNITFQAIEEKGYITSLVPEEEIIWMTAGDVDFVQAKTSPSKYQHLVRYTSSNNDSVKVSQYGRLEAVKNMGFDVVVYAGVGSLSQPSCSFTVKLGRENVSVEYINIRQEKYELQAGDQKKIIYSIMPANADYVPEEVECTSEDSTIVTIEDGNVMHALKSGITKIKVKYGDKEAAAEVVVYDNSEIPIPQDLRALVNVQQTLADISPGENYRWEDETTSLKPGTEAEVQEFTAFYTQDFGEKKVERICAIPIRLTTITGVGVETGEGGSLPGVMELNDSLKLSAGALFEGSIPEDSDYEIDWIYNNSVLQVNETDNGRKADIKPLKAGTAAITVQLRIKDGRGSFTNYKNQKYGTYTRKISIKVEDSRYVNSIRITPSESCESVIWDADNDELIINSMEILPMDIIAEVFGSSEQNQDTRLAADVTWKSEDAKVAVIKRTDTGKACLTVKGCGVTMLTVTAKDAKKFTKSIKIVVKNNVPQLRNADYTLNIYKTEGTSLDIFAADNTAIESIRIYDNVKDKGAGTESGIFTIKEKQGGLPGYELELKNREIKAKKYSKAVLSVTVRPAEGEAQIFELVVNITVKNNMPSVSVKQQQNINLFYTDSEVPLLINAPNEVISKVEWRVSDPGEVCYEVSGLTYNGQATGNIRASSRVTKDNYKSIKKKLTFTVYFEGYAKPVEKTITVTSQYNKPSLTTQPNESFLYILQGSMKSRIGIYDKTDKNLLMWEDSEITLKPNNYITMSKDAANNHLTLTCSGNKARTAEIVVKKNNWRDEVKFSHKMVVKENRPGLKLSQTSITFNLADGVGKSIVIEAGAEKNQSFEVVRIKSTDITGANAASKKILEDNKITLYSQKTEDGNRILITELNSTDIKPGTYKYNIKGWCDYKQERIVEMSTVTLSIKIDDKEPQLKVTGKGNINLLDRQGTGMVYTPKITNTGGQIINEGTGKPKLIGGYAALFEIDMQDDGKIAVKAKAGAALKAGQGYKFKIRCTTDYGKTIDSQTITIKPVQLNPKVTVTPGKSSVIGSTSAGESRSAVVSFTVTGRDIDAIKDVTLKTGAERFDFGYDEATGKGTLTLKDRAVYKTGSTITVTFNVFIEGGDSKAKPVQKSVKVMIK